MLVRDPTGLATAIARGVFVGSQFLSLTDTSEASNPRLKS